MSTVSYVDNLSITDGSQYVSSGAIHWEDDFNSNLSRWTIGVDASSQPLAVYDGAMDISIKDNFPSIYSQDISATVGETYGVSLEVMASTGTANPSCAGQGSGSLYAELEFYVNSQWVAYSANVFSPIITAPAVVYLAGVKAPSDKMRIKIRYLAPPYASQYWNTVTADLTSIKVTKKIWQSDRYNNYDFGARIYDPRIARFLSIDNFTNKSPYQSPYVFASNTPIQAIDANGDSTAYYNTKGQKLFVTQDPFANTVVIVPDNNMILLMAIYSQAKANDVEPSLTAVRLMRSLGMGYPLVPYRAFYDEYSHDNDGIKAKSSGWTNEYGIRLKEENNKMQLGDKSTIVKGGPFMTVWKDDDIPDLHLHPNAGNGGLHGPSGWARNSGGDALRAPEDGGVYWGVIVEPNSIWLHTKTKRIEIDENTFKKDE